MVFNVTLTKHYYQLSCLITQIQLNMLTSRLAFSNILPEVHFSCSLCCEIAIIFT